MSLGNRIRLSPIAAEAFFWLIVAWLLLDVLPGKLYLRLLAQKRAASKLEPFDATRFDLRTRTVSRVVNFISQRMPMRSACFHRAIAVDRMLRRRGIARIMHYGVLRENGSLKAHVWITSSGAGVIGIEEAAPYTEIAQFAEARGTSLSAAAEIGK